MSMLVFIHVMIILMLLNKSLLQSVRMFYPGFRFVVFLCTYDIFNTSACQYTEYRHFYLGNTRRHLPKTKRNVRYPVLTEGLLFFTLNIQVSFLFTCHLPRYKISAV